MSEVELVEKLAHVLSKRMRPSIQLAIDLWDIATVAQYLKRDAKVVRERIVVMPDFSKAIRLPATKGRAHPLNTAAEVIGWAEGHQEKTNRGQLANKKTGVLALLGPFTQLWTAAGAATFIIRNLPAINSLPSTMTQTVSLDSRSIKNGEMIA